ncbi:HzsA-related protein [Paraglaciecola chathamensis]|uniref:HzsA-related protein n=1 Tax=Paraglaciecola chathamensis TaxID=368405 RepID=UPI0026FFCCAC|nr:hypothetical protein [Paraglaciecola chathamensis]MDO6558271.1 hypothetical protein [Paraglaciecola chathamensis]
MLLKRDGTQEVLVDTEVGAITDPFISFDGKWVYYSYFPDVRPEKKNNKLYGLPMKGADIYKINLANRKITRLTHQEFTPNTGNGSWDETNPVDPYPKFNALGYGILNLGPAPIPGNKIIFSSSRNGLKPAKDFTSVNMQLFVMDDDGRNVSLITPMVLGSALHPTPLKDGRVLFSSYESQGLRDRRLWGIWSIYPDGRHWDPEISAFGHASVFHFMTQTSNGNLVFEDYYNKNNFGFGTLYTAPLKSYRGSIKFNSPIKSKNPKIAQLFQGQTIGIKMSFTPKGLYSLTPKSTSADTAATGDYGKFTHPSAAPNNRLLTSWSDGPVNSLNRPSPFPAVDSGIYIMDASQPINDVHTQLTKVINDNNFNEVWPRAVVPYKDVHGVSEPTKLPWLPESGDSNLPHGTPFGLIGSSSFLNRDTSPGYGNERTNQYAPFEPFNSTINGDSSNWSLQGSEPGPYSDDDIWAVRIVAIEPTSHIPYGPIGSNKNSSFFFNHANERMRILGEIPLRKLGEDGKILLDSTGHIDTSFLAKIPADVPFTFQTLDRDGSILNIAQTWHQIRPGEIRTDCGGCHAHSKAPIPFEKTAAASENYKVWDLTSSTPLLTSLNNDKNNLSEGVKIIGSGAVDIEFYKDIRPLLRTKCISCHTGKFAPASLSLSDLSVDKRSNLPNDYSRLCDDPNAKWGTPPLIKVAGVHKWRQTNASRYIRKFQSRRSLLIWKLLGRRLDGWNNDDHPTESTPGDVKTLPKDTIPNEADIDFLGTIMPPDNSDISPLSENEKLTFIRWIDLGCPVDTSKGTKREGYGWFLDETKPTLNIAAPNAKNLKQPLTEIVIGIADYYSGIDIESLSITASFQIDNHAPDTQLSPFFTSKNKGIYTYKLKTPIYELSDGEISVEIGDRQGNINKMVRSFKIN